MKLGEFKNIFIKTLIKNDNNELILDNLDNDTDLVDIGLDSMSSLIFISSLEKKLDKKLNLDKLEKYDFKISINNLYQAFFLE